MKDSESPKVSSSEITHEAKASISEVKLEKSLSEFMSFAQGYAAMGTVVSVYLVIPFGIMTGGPVLTVWSWLAHSFFALCIAGSMAEICSIYPACGSVYHWTAMLCPKPEWAPALSYLCGWFNLIGNVAFDAAIAFSLCQFLSAAFTLMSLGAHDLSIDVQVILSICVLTFWACKNTLAIQNQG
jgi:amino acid transporter